MLVIIAWLVLLPQTWTLIKPSVVSSCSWFVFPFSFSKSWERTGVGFSTILTSYNNVYMRRETFINVLPLQQYVCKQKPQHARSCMSRCLTTVPVPRVLSAQPCKKKLLERHRRSPSVGHWERLDLGKANPFSQILSQSTSLLSLAKANQPLNNSKEIIL